MVQQCVQDLSASDPAKQAVAAYKLERLPADDVPLLDAAFARHDLPSVTNEALQRIVPRVRQRAKRYAKNVAAGKLLAQFYATQALSGYEHGGHTNPKWDTQARAFLKFNAERFAQSEERAIVGYRITARVMMNSLLELGCNDPTVLASAGMLSGDANLDRLDVADLFIRADKEAVNSPGVEPLYRLIIDGRMMRPASELSRAEQKERLAEFEPWLEDFPVQYQRLLAAPGLPPGVAVDMASVALNATADSHAPLKPILDGVMDPLEKAMPNESHALSIKGRAYVDYAWEARGAGYADTVTPDGAAKFEARLEQAKVLLSKAWHMDADNDDAADDMLTVARGLGFDRPTMEMWYRRAVAADPDDGEAAARRLTFLEPKWLGDPDAMLAFGHECLADGNFASNIPNTLVTAHTRIADRYVDDTAAYWLRSGVWDDVRAVYLGYLTVDPENWSNHSWYARYAMRCHQWKVADAELKLLGNRVDATLFGDGSVNDMEAVRARVARLAAQPPSQGE